MSEDIERVETIDIVKDLIEAGVKFTTDGKMVVEW